MLRPCLSVFSQLSPDCLPTIACYLPWGDVAGVWTVFGVIVQIAID